MVGKFRKDAGFNGLRFHELRHTVATLLANDKNISILQTQKRLRHAKVSTTANYIHNDEGIDAQAASVMTSICKNKPKRIERRKSPRFVRIA